MKKKHRNITIDGDKSWAWTYREIATEGYPELKIWKDGKVLYRKIGTGRKPYPMTPGLIARFIKTYLVKETIS